MLNGPHGKPPRGSAATSSRDELIAQGIPLVRRLAARMAKRLPSNVELGDLVGAGMEGLVRAADAFDPSRNTQFEAYAMKRIRGAMLDGLRSTDSMTHYARRQLADVTRVIHKLERELGRPPHEGEIAQKLGVSLERYQELSEQYAYGRALAFFNELDPDDIGDVESDPIAMLSAQEVRSRLVSAVERLPPRSQTVVALYYQEECTQAEIGKILGITESRVCQILGDALARLRATLISSDADVRVQRKPRRPTRRPARASARPPKSRGSVPPSPGGT